MRWFLLLFKDFCSAEIENAQLKETVESLSRKIIELKEDKASLILASRNANDAATEARIKAQEALDRENRALQELVSAVKQTANFAALEGGAKQSIYPGIGPDKPEPKYKQGNMPAPLNRGIQANRLVGLQRKNYLQEYLAEELDAATSQENAV